MNQLINSFGRLRLLALAVTALPLLALPVLGGLWLWQAGEIWIWLLFLILAGAAGYGLHHLANRREASTLNADITTANPLWPPSAEDPWQDVMSFADELTVEQWPLSDGAGLFRLGRTTLERVARHYHPKREQPLLELTVPHTLLIIERASAELRHLIQDHVPLSHQLTLGDLSRAREWKTRAEQLQNVYRVGHALVDPSSLVFREFRREMSSRIVGYGSDKLQTWLLREYVRKIGFYAIELYSGTALLQSDGDTPLTSKHSSQDLKAAAKQEKVRTEPLRVLLLGRANAGKSSLINALFGEVISATDVLPDTTSEVQPYRLALTSADDSNSPSRQEGLLILDTPGYDRAVLSGRALKQAVLDADIILFVCAANTADRQADVSQLAQVRQWQQDTPHQRPAPLLLVVSHIDQLRPLRHWQPPYDLINPDNPKAANIQSACIAIANDLDIDIADVVPVCVAQDRQYNVADTLWAAILARQDEARRVRYLRCLGEQKKNENWGLLWQQLANSGRLLVKAPGKLWKGK